MGQEKKSTELTPSKVQKLMDWTYEKVLNGLPGTRSIYEIVADYSTKDKESAIRSLVNIQTLKTSLAGFVTGLGGLITLPVAVPADIASSLYVNMRMVGAIALLRGYDLKNDQVRTMVFATITGESIKDAIKAIGVKTGEKCAKEAIEKHLTRDVIKKINEKICKRFITKNGEKGIINATKAVPIVGGFISGAFDFAGTRTIAKLAKVEFKDKSV